MEPNTENMLCPYVDGSCVPMMLAVDIKIVGLFCFKTDAALGYTLSSSWWSIIIVQLALSADLMSH